MSEETPNLATLKKLAMGEDSAPIAPETSGGGSDYTPPPRAPLPVTTRIPFEFTAQNGAIYRAKVEFTVPNATALIAIGRIKSMIAPGGISGDRTAAYYVEACAYLTATLTDSSLPSWWAPLTAQDFDPYSALYKEVNAYAARFLQGDSDDGGASGDPAAGQGDASAEPDPSVDRVERRVRPPSERSEVLVSHDERGD